MRGVISPFTVSLFNACFSVLTSIVTAEMMTTELADTMNKRMLLMKDVAGYKAAHHLPVEDLDREQQVLSETKEEAEKAALDPSTVTTFIQALMDVGKAIQYRYLANWLSLPEKTWKPPENLEDVRKKITDLDKTILRLINQEIRSGKGFGEEQKTELMRQLCDPNIVDADKRHLVASLDAIKVFAYNT